MKFTIATNGKTNDVKINRYYNGNIQSIEIDFEPSELWNDLEFWLNDSVTDKFLDYGKMNITTRNKMKFYKK